MIRVGLSAIGGMLLYGLMFFQTCASATELCVDDTAGPTQEFSTIAAALAALPTSSGTAAAGYTIWVYPGTYSASNLTLPTTGGSSTNPVTVRAVYPARRPLGGGQWASNTADRAVLNCSTNCFNHTPAGTGLNNWVFDGFYAQGWTDNFIHTVEDNDFWIRNNFLDGNASDTVEDSGGIRLDFGNVGSHLIQNNKLLIDSPSAPTSDGVFITINGGYVVEYNECRLTGADQRGGGCEYFHTENDDMEYRYNFIWITTSCGTSGGARDHLCGRFRDSLRYNIHNNFWYNEDPNNGHIWVHENTQSRSNEAHQVHHNTIYRTNTIYSDFSVLTTENLQGPSLVFNNIVKLVTNDSDAYAIGTSFTGTPASAVTASNNLHFNTLGIETGTGITDGGGNSATNVTINTTTGCASSVDNATYGANLDVSQEPYRKCDGTAYACAAKFGQTCTVDLGSGGGGSSATGGRSKGRMKIKGKLFQEVER